MKTQNELFTKALGKIQVVGDAAEDVAIARAALGPLLEMLAVREICSVVISDDVNAGEIPDYLFEQLAVCLALNLRADFSLPEANSVEREDALTMLRRITATRPTYETLAVNYF